MREAEGFRQEYLQLSDFLLVSLPLKLTIAKPPHRLYLFPDGAVNSCFNLLRV